MRRDKPLDAPAGVVFFAGNQLFHPGGVCYYFFNVRGTGFKPLLWREVALLQCPHCGSYHVQKISSWAMALTLLASGGCLVWLATRFPPLWFLAGIALLFSLFVLMGKSSWRCLDCKHAWVTKKGEKNQVKQVKKEKEKK